MILFAFIFILYSISLSMRNDSWCNLRNRDKITYKAALKYQRCLNKVKNCDLDMKFLYHCKSNVVYPKFIRWTNIRTKNKRQQSVFYARLLNDEIKEKLQKRNNLNKEPQNCLRGFSNSTTWMKMQIIKYSVNCYINKQMAKVNERRWFDCGEKYSGRSTE